MEHMAIPGAADRLVDVREALAQACRNSGRTPETVELVCVSKTFEIEDIRPVIGAGQRVFGENRVQEARQKWPTLREGVDGISLHLIGPLQSNKAREAVELFDVIHTVDRPKIAGALADEMARQDRLLPVFVQVNTGAELQKAGVLPEQADAFIAECRGSFALNVIGLMCIPPVEDVPAPHFALLGKIAARNGIRALSMGMSADYGVAISQGASHVRIGSAIFGSRPLAR